MTFDKALRLTSILLASAAFIGLSLGAHLPDGLLLVTGTALILVLLRTLGIQFDERFIQRMTLSAATWNVLVFLAFGGFWIDLLWISGELLPAGVHFLLLLMVIKLFNLESRRDYLHLYAISFMAILAAAASTTELWYLPVFLAYLLTGVWTLVLYQLTRDQKPSLVKGLPAPSQESTAAESRVTPHLFWLANGLALGTLLFTMVIFFAIPRVSAGIGRSTIGESIRTSGFSETVDLGMIGPIKHDPGVVMRVQLAERPAGAPDHLYLRGMAYDYYNGRSWATHLTGRRALPEIAPDTFAVRSGSSRQIPAATQQAIHQTILLEALDTAVLFGASFPETITGHLFGLQSDQAGALYLPMPASSRIEYSVVSRPHTVEEADTHLQPATYSQAFTRHYLQLPEASDHVAALAEDVTQGRLSAYDKARAIQDHLTHHYRYSLDIPAGSQERPIEEFLFHRKTGYCEHYATAMVIMLRSVGVPARLVTGFLATEWNEYGNYYLVRQRDAHAWVEVYLPHSGWITMDPTPAVSEPPADPGWQSVGRMLDTLRLRWNRFFVQYSGADQLAVVRGLKEGTSTVREQAWSSLSSLWHGLGDRIGHGLLSIREWNLRLAVEFLGLVAIGFGLLAGLYRYRPWQAQTAARIPADRTRVAHLYERAVRHATRHGLIKRPEATPLEFLHLVRNRWAEAGDAMATITELYCRCRYGQTSLTRTELEQARQCLAHLAQCGRPIQ